MTSDFRTMPGCDYFQCLICQKFFGSSWKVEQHLRKHDESESNLGERTAVAPSNVNGSSRRGMLPINKVTFYECSVPVVKNQIDPNFLQNYARVEAKEEWNPDDYLYDSDNAGFGPNEDHAEDKTSWRKRKRKRTQLDYLGVESLGRSTRRGRQVAKDKIRQVAAVLSIPDQGTCEDDDGDMEEVENILKTTLGGYYEDDDFVPHGILVPEPPPGFTKTGLPIKKRGRKLGSGLDKKPTFKPSISKEGHTKKKRIRLERSFTCEFCGEKFPYKRTLNQHLVDDHKDRVKFIYCPVEICNRPLINHYSVQAHVRMHEYAELAAHQLAKLEGSTEEEGADISKIVESGRFCKFCLVRCDSPEKARQHEKKAHSGCKNLKCPCCDEEFEDSVLGLSGHVKIYHPQRLDPFDERLKRCQEYAEREKRFKCDKCDKAFLYKVQLKDHAISHEKPKKPEEERPYPCPACKRSFKYKDNLRRHFTLHLENNPFVCEFPGCNRKFNSAYNLRRHKSLHVASTVAANRKYCSLCQASFASADKLRRHVRDLHTPEEVEKGQLILSKTRQLRLVPVRASRIRKFAPHSAAAPVSEIAKTIKSEFGDEKANVKIESTQEELHLVDKIVLGADGEAVHIKGEQLSGEKRVSTITSHKDSSSSSSTESGAVFHMPLTQLITKDPIFKKLSKEAPGSLSSILVRSHKYMTGKTFTCQICNEEFSRAWTLQLHLKAIHNKTLMDEMGVTQGALNKHVNPADPPGITLMCGTCAYVAKNAVDLEKHMKTSHQRKHSCPKCGIPFPTSKKLQTHIKEIHQDVKNFFCKYCKKPFSRQIYKRNHEFRVHENSGHTGKQRCRICRKYFAPSTMYNHMQRHDARSAKPKCMLCGDVFACSMSLRRHIDGVHLGKPINKRKKCENYKKVSGLSNGVSETDKSNGLIKSSETKADRESESVSNVDEDLSILGF